MKNIKLLFALIALMGLSACDKNDSAGEEVGEGIEELGEDIQDAAN